jgi:hypothetical protein
VLFAAVTKDWFAITIYNRQNGGQVQAETLYSLYYVQTKAGANSYVETNLPVACHDPITPGVNVNVFKSEATCSNYKAAMIMMPGRFKHACRFCFMVTCNHVRFLLKSCLDFLSFPF